MEFIYHTNGKDLVVAETIYNEKKYKGEAKCAPGDKFDFEFGKKLAALRCEMKIRKETAKESLESADMYGETSRYFRRQAKMAMDRFEKAQKRWEELNQKKDNLYKIAEGNAVD